MKRTAILVLGLALCIACNTKAKKEASKTDNRTPATVKKISDKKQIEKSKQGTFFCKINGKEWFYTKASGIITKDRKNQKRLAIITFTKKLEKSSEGIQLRYDVDSFQLLAASIQLRFKSKEGKLFKCYYELFSDTKKKSPDATIVGTINVSNSGTASGNAKITNLNIKYESEKLDNPENATINVTGLEFSGVGYSDIDRLKKAFN